MRFSARHFINLKLLKDNFTKLKKIAPANKVLFMVKADAYGHGLVPIVKYAVTELNISEFGVATLKEAIFLRDELSDYKFDIYVFSDLNLNDQDLREAYLDKKILPVLSSMNDLRSILSDESFCYLPLCIKFNTGMNRLGVGGGDVDEIIQLMKQSGREEIFHLMSHLGSSFLSMEKIKRNQVQLRAFTDIKKRFEDSKINIHYSSIANSGAIEQMEGLNETHIRPGLMLYGPSSMLEGYKDLSSWDGKIISRLEAKIIRVFDCERGMPIGYGGAPAPDDGVIAIIPLGYGDGFSTNYQGMELSHNGMVGKVFGRVNMDMAQIFFPKECRGKIFEGEVMVFWDESQERIERFCQDGQTIPYEAFIRLSQRLPKEYEF